MRAAVAGAAALLMATALQAQVAPFGLEGSGLAYNAQLVVRYQGELQKQTGTLLGASGSAQAGPITLIVGGFTGTLRPSAATPSNPGRSARTTWVGLYVRPAPFIAVGGEAEARRYETAVGTAWVRLIGVSASVTLPTGVPRLAGTASLDYLPLSSASGSDTLSVAVRGTFGLSYSPAALPILVHVAYRIERFDFKAVGGQPRRLEQLDGIVVGAGLRIGR